MLPSAGPLPGLTSLVPSYLSMDADCRVVRLDSWSKVLAPGLRLGWVTAHPDIINLMSLALHSSLNGPPGISQVCPHMRITHAHETIHTPALTYTCAYMCEGLAHTKLTPSSTEP